MSVVLREVGKRVVVGSPWIDLILGSEFLSRRYGRTLLNILRRNPPKELKFRRNLRMSEFMWLHYGGKLYDALGRNHPSEVAFKKSEVRISIPWELAPTYCSRWEIPKEFEHLTVRWLTDYLRPGFVGIDVGANIGYFTVLMAKTVGPTGRVYAVEPAEDNLQYLRKNVERNQVDSVTILPFAAGSQSRVRNFYLNKTRVLHGLYKHHLGELREIVQVREVRLDQLVKSPVDVVKIDVEGAELEVLEGMTGILQSSPNVALIVEWNPEGLKRAGSAPDVLPDFLRAHGFKPFLIDNLTEEERSIEEVAGLAKSNGLDPQWSGNLICPRRT